MLRSVRRSSRWRVTDDDGIATAGRGARRDERSGGFGRRDELCTVIWYKNAPKDDMKVGILCWLYWGASLMWLVDAIFEYAELRAEYFTPAPADMLNDLYLGLSVVAFGLIIWLVILRYRQDVLRF